MSIRHKIADWIGGGRLTSYERDIDLLIGDLNAEMHRSEALSESLMSIADMETPKANATVRRMAKAAREASGVHDT